MWCMVDAVVERNKNAAELARCEIEMLHDSWLLIIPSDLHINRSSHQCTFCGKKCTRPSARPPALTCHHYRHRMQCHAVPLCACVCARKIVFFDIFFWHVFNSIRFPFNSRKRRRRRLQEKPYKCISDKITKSTLCHQSSLSAACMPAHVIIVFRCRRRE